MSPELRIEVNGGFGVILKPPVASSHERCTAIIFEIYDRLRLCNGRLRPFVQSKYHREALREALSLCRVKTYNPDPSWEWLLKDTVALKFLFEPPPQPEVDKLLRKGELAENSGRIVNLLNQRPRLPQKEADFTPTSCGNLFLDDLAGITPSSNNYSEIFALWDRFGIYELYQYLWKIGDIRNPDQQAKGKAELEEKGLMPALSMSRDMLIKQAMAENRARKERLNGDNNAQNN